MYSVNKHYICHKVINVTTKAIKFWKIVVKCMSVGTRDNFCYFLVNSKIPDSIENNMIAGSPNSDMFPYFFS